MQWILPFLCSIVTIGLGCTGVASLVDLTKQWRIHPGMGKAACRITLAYDAVGWVIPKMTYSVSQKILSPDVFLNFRNS